MKICVLGPCSVSGMIEGLPKWCDQDHTSPLVRDLADCYRDEGHAIHIVKFNVHARDVVDVESGDVRVTLVPRRARGYKLTLDLWLPERRQAAQAILAHRPDVIHAHWTYEYARAAFETDLRHVVTAHDAPRRLFRIMRPRFYWWPRLAQGFLVARKAQLMTAVSPYTADVWVKEMRRKGPIHVVPNGLPNTLLDAGVSMRIRQTAHDPVFGMVGDGFSVRKNTEGLLRAFARVRAGWSGAKLLVFGTDHGPGQRAETWAREQGLADGIEFRGRTPHAEIMRELRESVDVYVHPSLEESCCMAVLEAMASGLPVVGGKTSGGVPWQLEEGAGILCDVTNPDDLAHAMISAYGRDDLAATARLRVLDRYTTTGVAKHYLQLLEEAAG